MHSLSKGSTTARGGRDEEERSLRKLIETAKKYKGKGAGNNRRPSIPRYKKSKEAKAWARKQKKELFIQRRV